MFVLIFDIFKTVIIQILSFLFAFRDLILMRFLNALNIIKKIGFIKTLV